MKRTSLTDSGLTDSELYDEILEQVKWLDQI